MPEEGLEYALSKRNETWGMMKGKKLQHPEEGL